MIDRWLFRGRLGLRREMQRTDLILLWVGVTAFAAFFSTVLHAFTM